LRIILAPSAYYPHVGGIEELTRQLALTFKARGHEVSVLTNRWPEGVARHETLDGVHITRLRFPLPAANLTAAVRFAAETPLAAANLVSHVHRAKPDVLHVIGAGPQAVYVGALAPFLRTRIVFTAQGEVTFDPQDIFQRSFVLRAGLRRLLRVADSVTACSAYVLGSLPFPTRRQDGPTVVPNGVNPADFVEASSRRARPPYVAAAGRLVRQKGFDILIRALASPELSSLHLLLAGAGPEQERLRDLTLELGVEDQVQFIGQVDRVGLAELLAGATAFALPSRGEPFGIALLEAMAAGVPSVATKAGGVTEFACDRENALLVGVDDVDGMTAALAEVSNNQTLRASLKQNGLRTAMHFSWEAIAPRYEELYAPRSNDAED
jgi:glycogen(starch) synthase